MCNDCNDPRCLLSAGLPPPPPNKKPFLILPWFMSVLIKGGVGGGGWRLPLTVKYCRCNCSDGVGRKGLGIHDIILVVSGPTEYISRSRKVVLSLCKTQLQKLREFFRNCFDVIGLFMYVQF